MPKLLIAASSIVILLLFTGVCYSQTGSGDLQLIHDTNFNKPEYERRHIHFLASKSSNPVVKYNPVTLFFGGLMYFYQAALSPQISAECRFGLSCSNFSKSAIHEFGLIKGIAMSADRIMKCNRIAVMDARPGDYNSNFRIIDTPAKYRMRH